MTGELKKGKYVYYRCTGYRGKCDLPRFTEAEISNKLGSIFEIIRIPDEVLSRIRDVAPVESESNAGRTHCPAQSP